MAGRTYNTLDNWLKSKNVFDILLDVISSAGIGVTIVMSWGDHSFLHEFMAIANYITCFLLIVLKRPHKYIQILYILMIFVIAVETGGFK